ncbi:hypothetical protein HPB51_020147 [Rhipicephalus microplus]|uniref:Uncharacterized protein n=1 Tax=Rhipicephalus microplus TaxID=6941 RepID=A0A9J6F5G7_RHIMP|nr:hypothetical protein HPB51_020147 [Rhipicephalus microplus]
MAGLKLHEKKRTREPKRGGETRRRPFTKPDASRPSKHCQQGSTSKQDAQTAQKRYQGHGSFNQIRIPLAGKKTEQKSYYEQKPESEQKPQREPTQPPTRHRRGNTWRETERATQNHLVGHSHGTEADSAQKHPLSGRSRTAADAGLAARMEDTKKENRELRQELAKARKQNEKSTRKIEELQQTLNKILKQMGGHPTETPSSGASSSHGGADERDTTSAVRDGDTDMGCGGEYEAPVAVSFKRKSLRDSQHFEGAENHTQEPKRARPAVQKIDVIEEMVDKLTNKTERLLETLPIRLNESDAERNAQYAAVNNQLAAVIKRLEYLERGMAQLQQQGQGHAESGANPSTILNRSRNVNTTHTEKGGTHRTVVYPQHL